MRAAIVPSVFALVVPAAFISPFAARYVPLVIPLVVRIAGRRARRKAPPFAARSAPPK